MDKFNYKLIDTFPLASFFIDFELNILYANPSGLKKLNISISEIKNLSSQFFFPEISSCVKQQDKNIDTFFVDNNGNKQNILLKFSLIDEFDLYGILYIVEDNFSSKNVINQENFNKIILDNIPADIAVFDVNHNYLYINPNGISDVETRKWMIGKNDFDYCNYKGINSSSAQARSNIFNEVLRKKKQIEWVDEYSRDGKDIYILRRFYPVFIDDKLHCVIGYGVDISELKRIQSNLISNENRNKLVLMSAHDAIIKFDSQGKIIFWNTMASECFGWHSEEVLGKGISEFIFPPNIRVFYEKYFLISLKGNVDKLKQIKEVKGINKNKIEFPMEISILPLSEPNGIMTFCVFIRDITLRKRKEEKISLQNKMLHNKNLELEQFTYITSHDLQEPLLTLTSFSGLLKEEYSEGLNEEAKLYMEFINNSAIRMRALVTGLMEYARIGIRDDIKEIECNTLIDNVLSDLTTNINKTKAKITIENLPKIRGHETYIRLLFQNLISNAIKFNRENIPPKIKIKCSENENEWKFSVKDNGIGIDEKYIDQIFVIFKRLNSNYSGYGIGLAHCKKILDLHNGEIYVKSKLGVGSTFSFTISKNI